MRVVQRTNVLNKDEINLPENYEAMRKLVRENNKTGIVRLPKDFIGKSVFILIEKND